MMLLTMLQGNLQAALDGLLNLEKTARLAEDVTASKASCSAVLEVCYDARDWKLLEENIVLLAKRRGQLKQVCAEARRWQSLFVRRCCLTQQQCCRGQSAQQNHMHTGQGIGNGDRT